MMMMMEGQISIAANMSHDELRSLTLILQRTPQPTYAPTRDSCCVLRVVLPLMIYLFILRFQDTLKIPCAVS